MNEKIISSGLQTFPRFRGVYICLFFLLGMNLNELPILRGMGLSLVLFVLSMFYMFHHGILEREKPMGKLFMAFFVCCVFLFFHAFCLNLYELGRNGYLPFHHVYTFGGMKRLVSLAIQFMGTYALFRCFQDDVKEGVLFRAYAWGGFAFTFMLFVNFRGFIVPSTRLQFGDPLTGYYLYPNSIACVFLSLFYMNILAFRYARWRLVKMCHVIFCGFAVATIILAQSRGSFFALLLGLALALGLSGKRAIMILLAGTMLTSLFYMRSYNFENMLPQRFAVSESMDGGAHRWEHWFEYLTWMTMGDWLIGRSLFVSEVAVLYQKPLKAQNMEMLEYRTTRRHSWQKIYVLHNSYLETLVCFGVGGLIFYCFLAARTFYHLFQKTIRGKSHWIYITCFFSLLMWQITVPGISLWISPLLWALTLSQAFSQ